MKRGSRNALRGLLCGVALVMQIPAALAELEVISLRYRTVDQVLPILRPLVEPGGALSGQGNQLIVRTSPANLAELRKVLAAVDQPQRQLIISVRFDDAGSRSADNASVSGTLRGGNVSISSGARAPADRSQVDVRVRETRSRHDDRISQQVRVMDGGRAFIATGQSRPLQERRVIRTPTGATVVTESTQIQDIPTGFDVVPRVSGDRVQLEISPRREVPGTGTGQVNYQRADTTLTARLGEWIELGGTTQNLNRDASGLLSSSREAARSDRSIWVKVEEVRP